MILRYSKVLSFAVGVLLLSACSEEVTVQPASTTVVENPVPVVVEGTAVPATPPPPQASPVQEVISTPENRQLTEGIYNGSGLVLHGKIHAKSDGNVAEEDASALNFVNADIHDVAKAVLGDMLGLNYTIAPGVQGNITIKVNQSLPKDAILPALNTAFRLNGAAIIDNGKMVKVVPIADAPHQGGFVSFARNKEVGSGFGLQIVSLRNISAEEMEKILAPVAPSGGVIPVETTRNIIILSGTEEERAAMMDVVNSFDVDWLSGMSFGLFPLKEANAQALTHDLWNVLGSQTGPMSKLVRIVPFDRLNAVLVISSQPHYVKEVKTWINRLDVDQAPSERKLWVYQIQNGRASDLSHTLQKLLLGKETKSDATAKTDIASQMPVMPFSSDNGANAPPNTRLPAFDQDGAGLNPNDQSSQSLRIIADDTTNSLVIWANKGEYSLIQDALKKLDVIPMEVRIEAVIAEVTLTDDLRYGVQYLFQGKHGGAVLTNASSVSVASAVPGFSAFVTGSNINAILDLLQSVTTVNVISSPQLMVLNNQTAAIQVGDQVPIATQSAVSTLTAGAPVVNSIQMEDTGVIMKVTPRVNSSGMVLMDISQEVSNVTQTTTSRIDSPTIVERKISSSVAVRDGETIALGGMIQDNVTDDKNGIPLLEDIPYLGNLFSYTSKDRTRTELLALITPHVVRNDNDVRQVTDEMRQQMSAVIPLDAKIHH